MKSIPGALLEHPIIEVDLHQAIFALAEALSLVGVDENQHGERVAYMATVCARELGWESERIDDLFHAALLHDCGVSSSVVHKHLISEMDWEGAEVHCVVGAHYLKNFPPLQHLAPIVRYHHTHWHELEKLDLPKNIALASNLIYLVDRVDALRAKLLQQHTAPHAIVEQVRNRISDAAGELFAEELVETFINVSDSDAFWLTLEPLHLTEFLASVESAGKPQLTSYEDLRKLSRIFAHIVDAKSSFTFDHSLGVAQVARHLGGLLELPESRLSLIELAALLHDLGKLGVPDEILEKKGKLTAEETAIMHRHSYETFRILSRIRGFESIAEWAGNHHETLMGDGYPFQHQEAELSLEARIIAVADIFQALAQERPYRKAMQADEIIAHLQKLAAARKVDAELVTLAGDNLDSTMRAATAKQDDWLPEITG
jgi:HD-GYP domain-containing protein (c-di-GMP phosphodiesterase class II)